MISSGTPETSKCCSIGQDQPRVGAHGDSKSSRSLDTPSNMLEMWYLMIDFKDLHWDSPLR